jgi:cytoskeletal protein RodZ
MNKPSDSANTRLRRMERPFTLFMVLAVVAIFFGDQFLSASNYKVAFGVVTIIFLGFWLYGAVQMPAAISEQLTKSHHPDEDVRALQDGEISISQYAERKAAKESASTNATNTPCSEHAHKQSNPKA